MPAEKVWLPVTLWCLSLIFVCEPWLWCGWRSSATGLRSCLGKKEPCLLIAVIAGALPITVIAGSEATWRSMRTDSAQGPLRAADRREISGAFASPRVLFRLHPKDSVWAQSANGPCAVWSWLPAPGTLPVKRASSIKRQSKFARVTGGEYEP